MTSSISLKKIVSIGATLSLALAGATGFAAPASATPITNVKSMDYTMQWMPGESLEATFAPQKLEFQSRLVIDDVTAWRGEAITVSSLNTGLPNGMTATDYAFISFFTSIANRNAQQPSITQNQIYNFSGQSIVVPQTAVAMSVSYLTRISGGNSVNLTARSYTSTPRLYHNGTLIPSTNTNSGSGLYLDYSYATVLGASAGFTTPSTGTVQSTSYRIGGCIDMSAVTASTTYTARLKVNGAAASGQILDYKITPLGGYGSEVSGSSNSFGSGQLSTWRVAGQALKIVATDHMDSGFNASATPYDAVLEVVDQANNSLLKDCTPATPTGSGTLSYDSSNPSRMVFTPDSTLGAAAQWTVKIYKVSDNSVVLTVMGQGTNASNANAPMGLPWTAGQSYYARAVNELTINELELSSAPGTASPTVAIPAQSGGGSIGGPGGGIGGPGAPAVTRQPTVSLSGNIATAVDGLFASGSTFGNWEYCDSEQQAVTTPAQSGMGTIRCAMFFTAATGGTSVRTNPLDLTVTYYARPIGVFSGDRVAIDLSVKYLRWSSMSSSAYTISTRTVRLGAVTPPAESVDATDPSIDATDVAAPLPVWASNIVSSIPTLTKSLVTTGGSVALTGGDYADLKSVTIGGKAVTFKVETTGNVTIPVPSGEAGKTADIVIVFSGGTMVVQDGIKYVAPINIAKIGERPIAIAAGAKRITAAVADQIRQAAFANMTNNTISCVAYAANNTAKAKAAAKLIAVQACGIATKANPGLKAAEVTVIVNKAKAKKEAIGIKVFKVTN